VSPLSEAFSHSIDFDVPDHSSPDARNTPERQTFEDKGDEDRDFVFSEQALQATGQTDNDNWVEDGWDGPARPGGWADWLNRKVDRGDKW